MCGYILCAFAGVDVSLDLSEKVRDRVRYDFFGTCDSTMAQMRKIIDDGWTKEVCVVSAGAQKSGRGRYGRQWLSGAGNIFLSLGFCSAKHDLGDVVMCFSVLARRVLARVTQVYVKWPNDIYGFQGKLLGILAETYNRWCILGVGINTRTAPLSYVSSLAQEAQSVPTNNTIISGILEEFIPWLDGGGGFVHMREEWLCHALYLNQRVRVDVPGGAYVQGTFLGVDARGRALVMCEAQKKKWCFAHGSMRPVKNV